MEFSDYIVYVDESGDHSMGKSIDKDFPVFVLAFCVFEKSKYAKTIVSEMKNFKFKYFGHDIVNLHEREIRKAKGDFAFLVNKDIRPNFLSDLSAMIDKTPFTIIASVIRKNEIIVQSKNPYDMAMKLCLERLYKFLRDKSNITKQTYIIFERRGENEDKNLELEFRRVISGNNYDGISYPFQIKFATKQHNSAGLQLADMIARPIGIHCLRPEQTNIAYSIIEKKLHRSRQGYIEGYGLKIFP